MHRGRQRFRRVEFLPLTVLQLGEIAEALALLEGSERLLQEIGDELHFHHAGVGEFADVARHLGDVAELRTRCAEASLAIHDLEFALPLRRALRIEFGLSFAAEAPQRPHDQRDQEATLEIEAEFAQLRFVEDRARIGLGATQRGQGKNDGLVHGVELPA